MKPIKRASGPSYPVTILTAESKGKKTVPSWQDKYLRFSALTSAQRKGCENSVIAASVRSGQMSGRETALDFSQLHSGVSSVTRAGKEESLTETDKPPRLALTSFQGSD